MERIDGELTGKDHRKQRDKIDAELVHQISRNSFALSQFSYFIDVTCDDYC